MFSIINTGWAEVLLWFSPGSRAVSTLAPRAARPVCDARAIPGPSLLHPRPRISETPAAPSPLALRSSHTRAFSGMRGSSHTQEFAAA